MFIKFIIIVKKKKKIKKFRIILQTQTILQHFYKLSMIKQFPNNY